MNNFTLGDTVELKFKLTTDGTAAVPSVVNVVLGKDPALCFTAKSIGNNEWSALVTPVRDVIDVGQVQLTIDVILAGKLHTVIRREVTVADSGTVDCQVYDELAHSDETFVEPAVVKEPVVEPAPIVDVKPIKIEEPKDKVVDFTETEIKPTKKEIDESVKVTAPVIKAPIIQKKIELDFKSLVTEVEKNQKPAKKQQEKQITVNEITTHKTPFTLIKGKIITK